MFNNPPLPIQAGWRVCIYADTHPRLTKVAMIVKVDTHALVYIKLADKSSGDENLYRVKDTSSYSLLEQSFGTEQRLNGTVNLNVNFTLVDLTQFRVDVSPSGYGALTPSVDVSYISQADHLFIEADGLDVTVIDIDCK